MISSIAEGLPYNDFCKKIMSGEIPIDNFRRNSDYDLVVPGNRNGSEMFEHLEVLKNKYPMTIECMPEFLKDQGVFGNPQTYDFGYGLMDVPLIIQIYYLALSWVYFGNLKKMNVCEIGAGCGLQFKVMTDIFPSVKYTFVDLEAPLYIIKKHVEYIKREIMVSEYLKFEDVKYNNKKFDLVISDCAFNELHVDVQKVYIDKILNNSDRGRIAFYPSPVIVDSVKSLGAWETFKLLDKKTKLIKMDMRVPALYWDETLED